METCLKDFCCFWFGPVVLNKGRNHATMIKLIKQEGFSRLLNFHPGIGGLEYRRSGANSFANFSLNREAWNRIGISIRRRTRLWTIWSWSCPPWSYVHVSEERAYLVPRTRWLLRCQCDSEHSSDVPGWGQEWWDSCRDHCLCKDSRFKTFQWTLWACNEPEPLDYSRSVQINLHNPCRASVKWWNGSNKLCLYRWRMKANGGWKNVRETIFSSV